MPVYRQKETLEYGGSGDGRDEKGKEARGIPRETRRARTA